MAAAAGPSPSGAAGPTRGGTAGGFGGAEPWRLHLYAEASKISRNIRKVVAEQHHNALKVATGSKLKCEGCLAQKFPLDLVEFTCTQYTDWQRNRGEEHQTHRYCTECVAKMIRDSDDGERFTKCEESAMVLDEVKAACNHKMHLVVCPVCHCPIALTSSTRFHETFNRERVDSRLQFTVHTGATEVLSENFAVDRMCENQRRPFFGSFSSDNLLVLDFCGEKSTERESNASEVENVIATFERPNSRWVWLEGWVPDLSLNERAGWRYWKNFQAKWPDGWGTEPTMFMFVRRRRLLRTRVRFNDEVRTALSAYFGEDADDQDATLQS